MRIGFISMPLMGHLNPMVALARKLQSRGNDVVFVGIPDSEPTVLAAGIPFLPYCEEEYPIGSMARILGPAATMRGLALAEFAYRDLIAGLNEAAFEHLPEKLAEAGIGALVLDTIHSFIELVPMSLGIPYVHIWNVFPVDTTGLTPPSYFSWPQETTRAARARNIDGWKMIESFLPPLWAVAKPFAEKNGLTINWENPTATYSKLAVITQAPREFDFAESPWPEHFYYTGPFHDEEGRESIPFPWEKLSGKPLIYASLGTLVNGLEEVYRVILDTVATLPEIQVVVSVGSNLKLEDLEPIPSNAIVVGGAPQIDLLKRASLCITHAGLNTTLETLAQGVPMVAIPIGFDQPGVAARIAYHGVGEFVEVEQLTARRLSELIMKVLSDSAYRDKAHAFQTVIRRLRGLDLAADVIEQAFKKDISQLEPIS